MTSSVPGRSTVNVKPVRSTKSRACFSRSPRLAMSDMPSTGGQPQDSKPGVARMCAMLDVHAAWSTPAGLNGVGPRGVDVEHRAHRATPGFESWGWPPVEGMSLIANRGDLEKRARDFVERTGFTFTVLRPGTEEVIGCLYIYPAKDGGDAQVRSWVRADVAELDGPLHAAVSRWLVARWPFERVIYADRPFGVTCCSA